MSTKGSPYPGAWSRGSSRCGPSEGETACRLHARGSFNCTASSRGVFPRPVHLRVVELLAGGLPAATRRSFQQRGDAWSQVNKGRFSTVSPQAVERMKSVHSSEFSDQQLQ